VRATTTTVVLVDPHATEFSCLCETCLDEAPGDSFFTLLGGANIRGTLAPQADIRVARCRSGHAVVVRRASVRVAAPPGVDLRRWRRVAGGALTA